MPTNFGNQDDLRLGADFTIGVEASNKISVIIQLKDRLNKTPFKGVAALKFYISSAANGSAIASAPDSGAAISGSSGALAEWTNNISGMLITTTNGAAIVELTESGAGTFYLALVMPDGKLVVSGAITFA